MTTPNITTSITYTADGGTAYAVPFACVDQDHIVVTLIDANEVETVLDIGDDYTLTTAPFITGTVTTIATYIAPNQIRIDRRMDFLQETDFNTLGGYLPDVVEAAIDKATQQIIELNAYRSRSIRVALTESVPAGFELAEAASRAGKMMRFTSTGALELIDVSTIYALGKYSAKSDKSASWTLTADQAVLYVVDTSGGDVTITVPTNLLNGGDPFFVQVLNTGDNYVRVEAGSGNTKYSGGIDPVGILRYGSMAQITIVTDTSFALEGAIGPVS